MTVTGVTGTGSSSNNTTTTTATQSKIEKMGADEFMQLLLAELQNQDPLNPTSDKDFIAQLAQFNSLSQLTQMNENMKAQASTQNLADGSALIGKTITGLNSYSELITGEVTGVYLKDDKVVLEVGSDTVSMGSVVKVEPTIEVETTTSETAEETVGE
jgi:flagellar basal-body rod modification protein FlgD